MKALVFDVFGTVVDWRNGVAREARTILSPLGYSLDWLAFADAWRAQYQPGMDEVRTGKIPFVKLDIIHRRMLERILPKFGLEKVDAKVLDELFRRTLARPPSDAERAKVRELLKDAPRDELFRDLFWALLNSKDFLFNH